MAFQRVSTTDDDGNGGVLGASAAAPPRPPPPLGLMTDKAWAAAFAINVAITILSAVYFFPSASTVLGPILRPKGWDTSDGPPWAVMTCILAAASAFVVSLGFLLASWCMTPLKIALGIYVLVLAAVLYTLPDTDVSGTVGKFLPIVIALVSYCLLCRARARLAAANLEAASLAITSTPQIVSWAVCATAARYIWLAVGIVAYVGSMVALTTTTPASPESGGTTHDIVAVDCKGPWVITALSCECTGNRVEWCSKSVDRSSRVFLMVFWAVSISWSSDVGANLVGSTVADSVASRWSSEDNRGVTAWQSCQRVIHSSLGTLCKVAAIDCLSKPLRFLVGRLSHAFWVADACMVFLRFAVSYLLLQPLVIVGLYRTSFAEAVQRARALYRAHGLTIVVNDAMLVAGLSFLSAAFAALPFVLVLCVAVGSIWSSPPSPRVVEVVFLGVVAAILATLEVLLYAFKAVFVCLLQDPDSLEENHDRPQRNELFKAWRELQTVHPEMWEEDGEIQL